MQQDVVEANRQRDLWLLATTEQHVYYAPQGWCDAWSVADGMSGGLDYIDEERGPEPEIYCYAPLYTHPNSEVDTMFVSVADLQQMEEVDREKATRIHPAMIEFLDKIDSEA